MNDKKIVTRFPPSPTGYLHAGNYRTALFTYLFSLQNNGKFILRIEDTDKARSKKEYEDNIVESLEWLGIKHDEFYRQSERVDIHRSYINKLIASGHAFISKEIPKEVGDREEVIRFKNPNKKVAFNDLIRGKIEFDTTDLGDFIIARSMDEPVYHLVVVVDDHEMGVTHILRGEDHISNTPRHILIQEALGIPTPIYAHIPLLLSPDRSKLSKRKGAFPLTKYRDMGYLPQAMINYLALLGWNPGTEQEIFSLEELVKVFDLAKVQKGGAIFNTEKLNWFNKKYIEKLDEQEFAERAAIFLPKDISPRFMPQLSPLLKEKISFFGEIPELFRGELSFVYGCAPYDKNSLNWKQEKDIQNTKSHLKYAVDTLSGISEKDFVKEKIKEKVWPYAEEKGRGNVLWPIRFALSGKDRSPDPFIMANILGKEETLKRLNAAYELI